VVEESCKGGPPPQGFEDHIDKEKFDVILHLLKTKAYKISKITSVGGSGEVVVSVLFHVDVVVLLWGWGLLSRSRGKRR